MALGIVRLRGVRFYDCLVELEACELLFGRREPLSRRISARYGTKEIEKLEVG